MIHYFSKLNITEKIQFLSFFEKQLLINFKELYQYYPNFSNWFEKVKKELINNSGREIIYILKNQELVCFAILKKTNNEKKICTLIVKDNYRNQGFGLKLMKNSIDYLKNDIILSVNQNCINDFEKLLKNFNFKLINEKIIENSNEKEYWYKLL